MHTDERRRGCPDDTRSVLRTPSIASHCGYEWLLLPNFRASSRDTIMRTFRRANRLHENRVRLRAIIIYLYDIILIAHVIDFYYIQSLFVFVINVFFFLH